MNDTPQHVETRYQRMLLELSPSERLRMASRMFDTARRLMRAGMAEKSPSEVRRQLFLRLYGHDIHDDKFREKAIAAIVSHRPARP